MSENEIVAYDNSIGDAIEQLKSGVAPMFSSIEAKTEDDKLSIFDAVMGSLPLAEHLGTVIDVQNIIVQPVEMADETTGEFSTQPRVILITDKGVAYHAISKVLFRDIQNVLGIIGHPREWSKPLSIQVVREGTGTRKFFTLKRAAKK